MLFNREKMGLNIKQIILSFFMVREAVDLDTVISVVVRKSDSCLYNNNSNNNNNNQSYQSENR